MAEKGWQRKFDDPIETPDGKQLHTLREAIYPKATLDLLWAVLAEDPRQWPYKIEDAIETLANAPETASDPRLSELRRRREQRS